MAAVSVTSLKSNLCETRSCGRNIKGLMLGLRAKARDFVRVRNRDFSVEMEMETEKQSYGCDCPFPTVETCVAGEHRNNQTVVTDLDGTLLRDRWSFPYFFLIAFEAGGYCRSLLLLLTAPLIWMLYAMASEAAGMQVMVFVTFTGLKLKDIEGVSRAVLVKFYAEDVHREAWRVVSTFGKRVVVTANPRVMVEPFLKEMLGVDEVMGSEIEVNQRGRATGFLKKPGVLVGEHKEMLLKRWSMGGGVPHVGLGDQTSDFPFMTLCKEGYVVPPTKSAAVRKRDLPKQLVFHDGRLVQRPTPLNALKVLTWMPLGLVLSIFRVTSGMWVPMRYMPLFYKLTGVKLIIKGTIPAQPTATEAGILYVCNHRTLLDPVTVSIALGRPVPAVTYSISPVSEMLSPMPTVALSRDRQKDSAHMRKVLQSGCRELTLCPEGTTCREPFLLRFSALFAELSDRIVPVAVKTHTAMFHGTTARGNKAMDPFFCHLNLRPVYEIHFLHELPRELTCAAGKSSFEVANSIQRLLANTLGYECTHFTRKDKYRILAGNDGVVPVKHESTRSSRSWSWRW